MSCSVVPSRHIVLGSPIRGLRPRLPSLRSVLPSRQIVLNEIFCPRIARMDTNGCNGLKWRPSRSHEFTLMQWVIYLHVLWRSACQAHRLRLLLSNVVPVVVKNDMPLPPSLDSWKLVRPTRSPLNCKAKNSCRFVKFVGKIFSQISCKRAQ